MLEKLKKTFKVLLVIVEVAVDILVVQWYIEDHRHKQKDQRVELTVTSYRPVKSQTDGSPNITSINVPALMGTCAASQDLLSNGTVHYGDYLDVPGLGMYKVADTMNRRHKNHVDILVYTSVQEKLVGWRKNQSVKVIHVH